MANFVTPTSDKSKMKALILCIIGGYMGFHYFYVGRIGRGLISLFTANFLIFGWFADIINIILGRFYDQYGLPLKH